MRERSAEAEEESADSGWSWRLSPRRDWATMTPSRRRWTIALVACVVIGTGLVVWFALLLTLGKVSYRDVGYRVVDARSTVVRFEVTKPEDATAFCVIEAQEVGHGVVGRTTVQVPPAATRSVVRETTVRTSSLAVIGTVRSCTKA